MTGHGEADRWREGLDRIGADQPDSRLRDVGDGVDEPGGRLERVWRHEHDVGHRRRTVVAAEPGVVREPWTRARLCGQRGDSGGAHVVAATR